MATSTVAPMKLLRLNGVKLDELPEDKIPGSFRDFLELVEKQFAFRYDRVFFLYRLYLQLVATNWLNPSDREISEDVCRIILFMW
jgi:hypothetical protein